MIELEISKWPVVMDTAEFPRLLRYRTYSLHMLGETAKTLLQLLCALETVAQLDYRRPIR